LQPDKIHNQGVIPDLGRVPAIRTGCRAAGALSGG
jgi:hypothetical protein